MNSPYRIGTRKSPLALKQTDILVKSLQHAYAKDLRIQNPEIIGITTTGDRAQGKSLAEIGGKSLFIKEIEQALFEKNIDFGVHSLKDVEANLNPHFQLACVLGREIVNDVLIVKGSADTVSVGCLKPGAVIGTCSPRRKAQLLDLRSDLKIVPLTGNILTRLSKLEEGPLDAIVLAFAGLKRLDLIEGDGLLKGSPNLKSCLLSLEEMIPAVGQGVLVAEVLKNDKSTFEFLKVINHKETELCIRAERALLKEMGGDCKTPIAAYCSLVSADELILRAFYAPLKLNQSIRIELSGGRDDPEELGIRAATEIKKRF
ncbi:MAG: hydroxymethylbilane synthase [Alphaproteobacteria bacterium]|nr:hydroxymethylbilane synthase [Alphaproteobacteria bacterium]